MKALSLVIALILLGGCARNAAKLRCVSWRAQGLMFSTIDSCAKCVEAHGSANYDLIAGCALGMDASVLLAPKTPTPTSNIE